jgi:hypothetical protein
MTTEEVIELYISLERIFYNKPIPIPKRSTKRWDDLNRLRTLLEENEIPCDEFILVNVRAYRRKNVFPKTEQLLGIKALNRYNQYANSRYFKGKLFRTDPSSVLIYSTNIYYPIEDFIKPFDKDTRVLLIWTFVKEKSIEFGKEKTNKLWEVYQYTLAKYEWFKQTPPDSLLAWGAQLDERRQNYGRLPQ